MRVFLAVLTSMLVAMPALAQRFTADIINAPEGGITLADIQFGEDLIERADDIGERELDRLARTLSADLERELREAGFSSEGIPNATLIVTIQDAVPNRPTLSQQGARGLDFRSFGIGGADLSAVLVNEAEETIATFEYGWRTPEIRDAQFASTWTDADRTFDRFARRLADALVDSLASDS